jgi:hypothetical protein
MIQFFGAGLMLFFTAEMLAPSFPYSPSGLVSGATGPDVFEIEELLGKCFFSLGVYLLGSPIGNLFDQIDRSTEV